MSTLLLSYCSLYRQAVTATVSLSSAVLRVVTERSEKFDIDGDDNGASEDSNSAGNMDSCCSVSDYDRATI